MEAVVRSWRKRATLLLTATLLMAAYSLPATDLAAQDVDGEDPAGIRGIVIDVVTGDGLPGVTVLMTLGAPGSRPVVRTTDFEGRFVILAPVAGLYDVAFMRYGYQAVGDTVRIQADADMELIAEMIPEAVALDPLVATVEGGRELAGRRMDGFYQRRESFPGDFLTRSDIAHIDPESLSHLLVHVGSFRLVAGPQPGSRPRVIGRGGCAPSYYVNGAPLIMSPVDMLSPDDLEAMEVYRGSTAPAEFRTAPAFPNDGRAGLASGSCGTVVLWTQDGERVARQSSSASESETVPGSASSQQDWMPLVWVVASVAGTFLFGR